MHLTPEDVAQLEAAVEIEIETSAETAPATHRTIIWVVTDGPDAFIRSVRGVSARWHREATARPDVTIHAGDKRIRARAVPVADPASIARITAALKRKYAGDPDLGTMLVPEILDANFRLEPA